MQSRSGKTAVAGRLFLGAAACIALYLAAMSLGGTVLPGCAGGPACQETLQSEWAYAFGIPVSFAGLVAYSLSLLLSWAFVRRDRTFAGLAGGMALSTVLAAAVWFGSLQLFALKALCVWCTLAHGCAVTGAFLLWRSRLRQPLPDLDCSSDLRDAGNPLSNDRVFRFLATGSALVAVGLLALSVLSVPRSGKPQEVAAPAAAMPPAPVPAPAVAPGLLTLFDGELALNPGEFPALGSGAPGSGRAVLLCDYTSSRCRQYLSALGKLLSTGPDPLCVVVLPVADAGPAADVHRALLTLFQADPSAWEAVSALLTSGQIKADPDVVIAAAKKRLGAEKWAAAEQDCAARVDRQIELAQAVMKQLAAKGKSYPPPLLLCGGHTLRGAELDAARVRAFLKFPAAEDAEPPADGEHSARVVTEPEIYLTDLQPGEARNLEIQVRNSGGAPLKLAGVSLEAGCEIARLPAAAVAPGGTASLSFRIHPPAGGDGEYVCRLKIHSNDPASPRTVTVRGGSAPQVAVSEAPVPNRQ